MNQPHGASAIDVVSQPWAFTQNQPLDTAEFINEAKKRGFKLDVATLRELYRHRLLMPFVMLTHRPVREPAKPDEAESPYGGTRLTQLRWARDTGRLRDLSAIPYMQSLPFERGTQKSPHWWNGLLYSQYQLLALHDLEDILAKRRYQKRGSRIIARLPELHQVLLDRMEHLRKTAIALTAIEARYLPNLDPEWIQLTNVPDPRDWADYRTSFDPAQTQMWLAYPSDQLRQDAERLLSRASSVDPVGDDWSQLMRRAPAKAREHLKDAALLAMDDRIAAEMLLRFYEDLALRGRATPLPDFSGSMAWHPLMERLSYRRDTLDQDLMTLGISPHPRVVLALEGETEVYYAPLVRQVMLISEAPELIRILNLGGVSQNLLKVAALNIAPLIGEKIPGTNAWQLLKPPAHLLVAVDPDTPFNTPENCDKERTKILSEIKDVLKAQSVERPNPDELDHLIEIRTWDESCFEFAHFTDQELADGIMTVHQTIDGWTRDELIAALDYWRDEGKDIKLVWFRGRPTGQPNRFTGRWEYEVSKTKLAEALWPTLLQKVQLRITTDDAPVPPIMKVIEDAYHLAQQRRYQSFVLSEVQDGSGQAGA